MALNLNQFKASLKQVLIDIDSANNKNGVSKETAMQDAANALAVAIDAYIKTAEVTVTALPSEVSVTGSMGPSANATALVFKGGDATHTGGLS